MMNFLTKSLSIEIENFVSHLKQDCGLIFKIFTKSGFVQCRKKIQPKVFKKLSTILVDEFYTDNEFGVKLWNGFRILAVDGSSITLPFTKEPKKRCGLAKNQTNTGVVQARVSVLYDVLNKYVLDSQLSPKRVGGRALGLLHFANYDKCVCELMGVEPNDFVFSDLGKKYSLTAVKTEYRFIKTWQHRINKRLSFRGRTRVFFLQKKDQEAFRLKADSYVVKTDVHFPTDYNLLWEAIRKCIEISCALVEKKISGWRKASDWKKQVNIEFIKLQKTKNSGGKNKEVHLEYATK
jgi:hypothetical protein